METTEALLQSPVLSGAAVRTAKDADRIDGLKPRLVVEPGTPEEVAALLGWASREQLTVVIRGGGTKLGWGRTPAPVDLLISMRALSRVLAHEHADLTATCEAGATLEEFNAVLARHGQWLPIDGAGDATTVGGAIATNDSGPLRYRYGTPRDLLIGVRLATADGRLVKAGGNVVKNVAGYDLGKLVSGSFGSLAVIVAATFKLLPVPAASQTLIATFQDRDAAARAVAALSDSQLEPIALELVGRGFTAHHLPSDVRGALSNVEGRTAHGRPAAQAGRGAGQERPPLGEQVAPYHLLVRFATAPAATEAQVVRARALVGSGEVIGGEAEAAAWRRYQARASTSAGAVIRFNWLPAMLPQLLALVEELRATGGAVELLGRAAIGAGLLRIDGAIEWQASVVEQLRARSDLMTHVTLRDAAPALKEQVDVWGPLGHAATLGSAVKRALDPMGILNAGRGPI